jgi:hypothetical protein
MSPTSYQTAPPRAFIIATGPGRVKLSGDLVFQFGALAGVDYFCRVDGDAVDLFLHDFSVFPDQEIYAAGGLVFVDVDAVTARGFSPPVAEQGESHSNLFGEGVVGEGTIHAHTQDLGVGSFQFLKILLEVFHLLGSTAGESEDVEGQHDILFAAILAERHIFQIVAIEIGQLEVGSSVAHLECRRGVVGLLSAARSGVMRDPPTSIHAAIAVIAIFRIGFTPFGLMDFYCLSKTVSWPCERWAA